jgi:hypothetical protein
MVALVRKVQTFLRLMQQAAVEVLGRLALQATVETV